MSEFKHLRTVSIHAKDTIYYAKYCRHQSAQEPADEIADTAHVAVCANVKATARQQTSYARKPPVVAPRISVAG